MIGGVYEIWHKQQMSDAGEKTKHKKCHKKPEASEEMLRRRFPHGKCIWFQNELLSLRMKVDTIFFSFCHFHYWKYRLRSLARNKTCRSLNIWVLCGPGRYQHTEVSGSTGGLPFLWNSSGFWRMKLFAWDPRNDDIWGWEIMKND